MGTINRACDVDGCDAAATTRYLDASGAVPIHFVICDDHATRVLDGDETIVRDRNGGHWSSSSPDPSPHRTGLRQTWSRAETP